MAAASSTRSGSARDDSGTSNTAVRGADRGRPEKLDADPEDQQALLDLVRYYTLSATAEGVQTIRTPARRRSPRRSRSDLENAVKAWQDYLALKPDRANAAAAASAVQAYRLLLDAGGAAEAQQVVADSQKTAVRIRPARLLPLRGLPVRGGRRGRQAGRCRLRSRPTARRSRRASRRSPSGRREQKELPTRRGRAGAAAAAARTPPRPRSTDPFGALGTDAGGGSTTRPAGHSGAEARRRVAGR